VYKRKRKFVRFSSCSLAITCVLKKVLPVLHVLLPEMPRTKTVTRSGRVSMRSGGIRRSADALPRNTTNTTLTRSGRLSRRPIRYGIDDRALRKMEEHLTLFNADDLDTIENAMLNHQNPHTTITELEKTFLQNENDETQQIHVNAKQAGYTPSNNRTSIQQYSAVTARNNVYNFDDMKPNTTQQQHQINDRIVWHDFFDYETQLLIASRMFNTVLETIYNIPSSTVATINDDDDLEDPDALPDITPAQRCATPFYDSSDTESIVYSTASENNDEYDEEHEYILSEFETIVID
jgi:hypothetical protein